jgi:ribosomal RNA-processing protein 1
LELLKIWKGLFFCEFFFFSFQKINLYIYILHIYRQIAYLVPGFYHSDRPLTQQALARELSYTLVPSLPRESRLRFLRAFWITIGRDFHALDRVRLDKYLFLIRCYVGVAFEVYLKGKISPSDNNGIAEDGQKKRKRQDKKDKKANGKRRKQSTEEEEEESTHHEEEEEEEEDGTEKWSALESYITLLENGPLCPINFDPTENNGSKKSEEDSIPMPHGPDGLRYHITDIWLDELAKVIDKDEDGSNEVALKDRYDIPMDLLLRPFEKLNKESPTKSVRQRASEEVLKDERLVQWGFKEKVVEDDNSEEDEDEEWGGLDD